ncbi:MAG TPA: hypothetical protein VNZ25_10290 [Candidatus Angelobacter sp.]|nr:hypothetical protein [Candidatus Angelobacter sp.]
MDICTSNKDKWIAVALIPFKAFIVIAAPLYLLFRAIYPHPLWTDVGNNTSIIDPVANGLLEAFILCAPILLLGGVIQVFAADKRAGIRTFIFAAVPTLVLATLLFLWVVSHLL